jgi:hypothetical protein
MNLLLTSFTTDGLFTKVLEACQKFLQGHHQPINAPTADTQAYMDYT